MMNLYKDIGVSDMKYDEFKKLCRKTWSKKRDYLCVDMTRNKKECKYRIFNENKNTYFECIPKVKLFNF